VDIDKLKSKVIEAWEKLSLLQKNLLCAFAGALLGILVFG